MVRRLGKNFHGKTIVVYGASSKREVEDIVKIAGKKLLDILYIENS